MKPSLGFFEFFRAGMGETMWNPREPWAKWWPTNCNGHESPFLDDFPIKTLHGKMGIFNCHVWLPDGTVTCVKRFASPHLVPIRLPFQKGSFADPTWCKGKFPGLPVSMALNQFQSPQEFTKPKIAWNSSVLLAQVKFQKGTQVTPPRFQSSWWLPSSVSLLKSAVV